MKKVHDFISLDNDRIEDACKILQEYNITTKDKIFSVYNYYAEVAERPKKDNSIYMSLLIAFLSPILSRSDVDSNLLANIFLILLLVFIAWIVIGIMRKIFVGINNDRISMILFTIYIHYDVLEEKLVPEKKKRNSKVKK